jgi:hypothetical protein
MNLLRLLVVALLLAGCAERAEPRGQPPPDSPISGPTDGPTPVPGPTALPVSPRSGLVDVRWHIWDRAKPIGPQRIRVEFYGGVEECEGLARVKVEETDQAATITLFVGRVPTAEVCIEIAVLKSVTVELERPLGDRRILDGAPGI